MSKQAASRGSVSAFCFVPVLAIISMALLAFTPGEDRASANQSPVAATPQATRARVQATYAALPLAFEQNQGQTDDQVKYMARGNGYTLFLTATDTVFALHSSSASGQHSSVSRTSDLPGEHSPRHNSRDADALVRMELVGGTSSAKITASNQLSGSSNYFLGNDPSKWRRNVPRYARVAYENVYPGVNMAFHGVQRRLEFDFLVAPRANVQPIDFHFTGAKGLKTDDSGNLLVSSAAGDVVLHKPVAYQEQNGARQTVNARFALKANNHVGFELGAYDHSRELIIDPSVTTTYATYLGGSGDDEGDAIAFDGSGNAYVTGQTASTNFPLASNSLGGGTDAFVAAIKSDGSALIYSTYVGGSLDDGGNGIALDSTGNAFVTGGTASTNFPVTSGAFQTTLGSGALGNAFVFTLSTKGALTYCTYLGGTGDDVASGIAFDKATGVYAVVGSTSSTDFPVTTSALQSKLAGTSNGFVSLWNASTNKQIFTTYLGGGSGDTVNAVALDSSDNVYTTGKTSSPGFPTTNPLQSKCGTDGTCNGGLADAFVTVMNAAGTSYVYSTFLGGSNNDVADGIAVDYAGNAYVTGLTESSTDFPLKSALQGAFGGGSSDAFVAKISASGTLVYSTYLGGSLADAGASVAVDSGGDAYITGYTNSPDFPAANATQTLPGGGFDAFASEINSTGAQLLFSTYLGGSLDEDQGGNYGAVAVDAAGANIYVTGNTASTDFPTHAPYPYAGGNANGGGTDAFVAQYGQAAFGITATTPAATAPGTPATSTVTLTAYNGYTSSVNLSCAVTGTGTPLPTCSIAPSVTPTTTGATTTLTITTTAAGGSHSKASHLFPAIWLPVVGISFVGIGFSSSRMRRKQLFGFLMTGLALSALILLPACGGSSSGGGGGGTCAAAPTVPTGLAASSTTGTGTTLNWTASTAGANCTVTGYTVYQDGKSIGTPTTTSLAVTGLTPATAYSFTVAATDSAGTSAQSTALSVTTVANYTITITGVGMDTAQTTRTAQVILTVN